MAAKKLIGVLTRKAGNGKGFQLDGNEEVWFNANEKAQPYLAKIKEGSKVEISYFEKGVKRDVGIIKEVSGSEKTKSTTAKPKCEVCGTDLKDNTYPTCYNCKGKTAKKDTGKQKTYSSDKIGYGSPEDIAGKEVGCSANVAGAILSGRQEDPATLLDMFRIIFNGVLEHVRNSK